MAIIESGEVTLTPVKGNINVFKQPELKSYELDWDKVNSFSDVVLILKLLTGAKEQPVFLYLTDAQADTYKHLFKDESNL